MMQSEVTISTDFQTPNLIGSTNKEMTADSWKTN
jgi:hypothetical protein